MAGFLDKIKGMFGGAKSDATTGSGGVDGLKDQAGAAKDKADDLVDEHSDKIPDNVRKAARTHDTKRTNLVDAGIARVHLDEDVVATDVAFDQAT